LLEKEDELAEAPEGVYIYINGCRSYLGGATEAVRQGTWLKRVAPLK